MLLRQPCTLMEEEEEKCADQEFERQIRCFPYGERSGVPPLQQVERQRNLGLVPDMPE